MLRLYKGEAGEIHVNRNQDALNRVKIKQTRTQTMKRVWVCVVTAASRTDARKYIRSYTQIMVYYNTQCVCVCVYIYIYVCVCVYIYIYIYVCVCVCVCIRVWKRR